MEDQRTNPPQIFGKGMLTDGVPSMTPLNPGTQLLSLPFLPYVSDATGDSVPQHILWGYTLYQDEI